jgi:hypothetical protein
MQCLLRYLMTVGSFNARERRHPGARRHHIFLRRCVRFYSRNLRRGTALSAFSGAADWHETAERIQRDARSFREFRSTLLRHMRAFPALGRYGLLQPQFIYLRRPSGIHSSSCAGLLDLPHEMRGPFSALGCAVFLARSIFFAPAP